MIVELREAVLAGDYFLVLKACNGWNFKGEKGKVRKVAEHEPTEAYIWGTDSRRH